MKLETPHLIVGIIIIALVVGAYFVTQQPEQESFTVSLDGIEVKDPSLSLAVYGAVEDVDYINSKDAYVVEPEQEIQMSVSAWNPDSSFGAADYKCRIYTESKTLYDSSIVRLEPNEDKIWFYDYTCPSSDGRISIYVESAVRTNEYDVWWFDDFQDFDILVVSEVPTEEPTEEPTPDPCDGVICDPYCEGTTYYYNGYCDNGQCIYQKEYNSAECVTETPTGSETGTETPTPTPIGTPDPDPDGDISGILWWGGGIIVVLLVLLVALRSKKK